MKVWLQAYTCTHSPKQLLPTLPKSEETFSMSSMEATDVGEAYCKIRGQNWMLSDEEKNVHREGATDIKIEEKGEGGWDDRKREKRGGSEGIRQTK